MTTWTTTERIDLGPVRLEADLTLTEHATGVVLFAHGSGSSRHSPRNRAVARELHRRGFATLLADLLTTREDTRPQRFDIGLLADRLVGLVDWLRAQPATAPLPLGLFGASTGAAAALVAAAARPEAVRSIVCRGGRPDLAGPALIEVLVPTLLIVGSRDEAVLELNEQARNTMRVHAELRIIPDATHLFEEPGALETVAEQAGEWFGAFLTAVPYRRHPALDHVATARRWG
ncbi:DeoR family transcriptional regulator [Actinoplanes sp. SE50]|uniref:dienelactone hydrolase family protein n=1 Tax=unclassified Actinoplanes TaxID=2626549 RepID=UPI00023EC154|nr:MULTISPECIES: alpha/beta fold hydrolase [unclassified Actinoplanes]AEV86351.1 dienelactone hydrolase [Actinoplanes sp. SE50/110]ATO84748.1 DeoR family transcriptional regulator [Actinoplanes sp. SE50]SLM02158.1 DeoR family transcriptional regulator [Actinoplanes sp. SE50/110]